MGNESVTTGRYSRRDLMGITFSASLAAAAASLPFASAASATDKGQAASAVDQTLSTRESVGVFRSAEELKQTIGATFEELAKQNALVPAFGRGDAQVQIVLEDPELILLLDLTQKRTKLSFPSSASKKPPTVTVRADSAHDVLIGNSSLTRLVATGEGIQLFGDRQQLASLQMVPLMARDIYKQNLASAGRLELLGA